MPNLSSVNIKQGHAVTGINMEVVLLNFLDKAFSAKE